MNLLRVSSARMAAASAASRRVTLIAMLALALVSIGATRLNATSPDQKTTSAAQKSAAPADDRELLGPMMNEIGGEAAAIVGGSPRGMFIYAEAGKDWMEVSLFKETAKRVARYEIPPYSRLKDMIAAARRTESKDAKRQWAVMEYAVIGKRFETRFDYPDEVKVVKGSQALRDARLKQRFGDKPIVDAPPRRVRSRSRRAGPPLNWT